ncbi:MAG: hypothetical protein HUJ11_07880, partial [Arenibacter algicola]|nr:hypothetical protein [Arenibacter algicola]
MVVYRSKTKISAGIRFGVIKIDDTLAIAVRLNYAVKGYDLDLYYLIRLYEVFWFRKVMFWNTWPFNMAQVSSNACCAIFMSSYTLLVNPWLVLVVVIYTPFF